MNKIIPILHNIRSLHNVGSILRTSDGLGLNEVWVSGYTPYPLIDKDPRLPHVSKRATDQIAKAALGAERSIKILHFDTLNSLVDHAENIGVKVVAVEQAKSSTSLADFRASNNVGLVFGNEVDGLDAQALSLCQQIVELPMKGKKESFNVSVTAGIVLYTVTAQLQDC